MTTMVAGNNTTPDTYFLVGAGASSMRLYAASEKYQIKSGDILNETGAFFKLNGTAAFDTALVDAATGTILQRFSWSDTTNTGVYQFNTKSENIDLTAHAGKTVYIAIGNFSGATDTRYLSTETGGQYLSGNTALASPLPTSGWGAQSHVLPAYVKITPYAAANGIPSLTLHDKNGSLMAAGTSVSVTVDTTTGTNVYAKSTLTITSANQIPVIDLSSAVSAGTIANGDTVNYRVDYGGETTIVPQTVVASPT